MKTQNWLVYYKQRAHGSDRWTEANGVTDKHPAAFLLDMLATFPDHESILMWAIDVTDAPLASDLIERL